MACSQESTAHFQGSGDSSEDAAVSGCPQTHQWPPMDHCAILRGQACREALPAVTEQRKDQRINRGRFSADNSPIQEIPEVHRGFKYESGPKLLFCILTTLRHQVSLTEFPSRLSAGSGQEAEHFSGAPSDPGQHCWGWESSQNFCWPKIYPIWISQPWTCYCFILWTGILCGNC